jgi:hypothetical protein
MTGVGGVRSASVLAARKIRVYGSFASVFSSMASGTEKSLKEHLKPASLVFTRLQTAFDSCASHVSVCATIFL